MSHVFISYSKQDILFARHLRNLLDNEGFAVWMDETQLVPSEHWWPTIVQNIETCAAMVVIMSPRAESSEWVQREVMYALNLHKTVFPVLLEGRCWPLFVTTQYEDMTDGLAAALSPRLARGLDRAVPRRDPAAVPPPLPGTPITPSGTLPQAVRRAEAGESPRSVWAIGAAVLALIVVGVLLVLWASGALSGDGDKGTQPLDSNTLLDTMVARQSTETAAAFTRTPTPDMTKTLAAMAARAFAQTATAAALEATAQEEWRQAMRMTSTQIMREVTQTAAAQHIQSVTPTDTVNEMTATALYAIWQATQTGAVPPSATPQPTVTLNPLVISPTPTYDFTPTPIPAGSAVEFGIRDEMTVNGVDFVYVPSGCFLMGSNDIENAQPAHKICLSAYWIGKTEVTNAQYKLCVEEGGCTVPGDTTYYDDAEYADHPVVSVNREQVSAYAVWLSEKTGAEVQLPTEAQWEYAAAGPKANRYPWGGADPTCQRANISLGPSCVGGTSPVGSYTLGASWVGALDMGGNVREWTADWYSQDYYTSLTDGVWDPLGPVSGEWRILRGGSWYYHQYNARCVYRYTDNPLNRNGFIGFRVVARIPLP